MKFNIFIFITIFSFLFSNNISGYELAELLDQKKQPLSSKTEISMTLINLKKDRSKLKEMVSITKDDGNKMLLFFKSPKRDKGVGFLKIEDSNNDKLSLFIPKLKKIRRISSSNQSDSFMGSDLSFEDMLSRDLDEFNYNILESEFLPQLLCGNLDPIAQGIIDGWANSEDHNRVISSDLWSTSTVSVMIHYNIQKGYYKLVANWQETDWLSQNK